MYLIRVGEANANYEIEKIKQARIKKMKMLFQLPKPK
jgi:hypothetical protein